MSENHDMEERKSDNNEQAATLVNDTGDEVDEEADEEAEEMTELQRAQYDAKVDAQIARWYHADELRNTKGSARVRHSARAMADLINAINGLPGGQQLMQRLSNEIEGVEAAMKEVVSAYLVKAARIEGIERTLNVFQEATAQALTGLKGCQCRSTGNCATCACADKDVPMCNDNCGCGEKCLISAGKKNGIIDQMEKKAKKAAKKLAEEEKERCKAIRDRRAKDEKRRVKKEAAAAAKAEQKLKEKKKAKVVKQTKPAKAAKAAAAAVSSDSDSNSDSDSDAKKKPKKKSKSKKQESSDEEEEEDEESDDDSDDSDDSDEEEEKPKKKKGGKRR